MLEFKVHNSGFYLMMQNKQLKARNTRMLMKDIAGDLEASTDKNFEREGRPLKWKLLAESTREARAAKNKWPGKILQVSRDGLRNSIESRYSNDIAIIGTNVEYARIHQKGGMAGKGRKVKIPKRSFLKLTRPETTAIKNKIRKWFE